MVSTFSGLNTNIAIKLSIRQVAEIREFVLGLNESMRTIIGRANKLVTRKVIPLTLPLLSTEKVSAKRARHDGIPKPKDAPDRKENNVMLLSVTFSNKTNVKEVSTQKVAQK